MSQSEENPSSVRMIINSRCLFSNTIRADQEGRDFPDSEVNVLASADQVLKQAAKLAQASPAINLSPYMFPAWLALTPICVMVCVEKVKKKK